MTVELSINCTQRLEEVKQWFGSLPEGVAEMRIETLPRYGVTIVWIRPLLQPEAAPFQVSLLVDDQFHVTAGREGDWREIPCSYSPVDYCRAIVSGGLTDVERLWRGRVVSTRT